MGMGRTRKGSINVHGTDSVCKLLVSPVSMFPYCGGMSGEEGEMENIEITYELHERLQLDNTKEATVILTARR